ncbi:MAG: Gfo/Idh/MocA family oxidoreductase [Flavobacteriaceae bacterium]|uniref:Gfo/Idh/MocA family oxidoreductase n=1 Tax=Flavobacterium kayseriense TaxID=2764714 RepID=A0ABR7J4R5_9FLAO|nr:Gfo/Idh/MocA family oxidoreductase [Flavobacterium kayseriense]MBC5840426.1 Gfo/Idh/MocA family oxidoreductase [Flavobacterium kayseriense]MBC5846904.1 Gfo/Idh/MocA family oxidoreductase [Flavobacterium kayseriense]MBX9888240.1 Gfo/Idh/MocA family oxidoreductase [Flavobacteriaceae bacterium]
MQKIKTALLSYGMSGKVFHAPFLALHPGFELLGSWERTKKLIQLDFPVVLSYPTLEAILKSESDLVIINTPVATHYEYAKQVLQAGKHAIVEKAFTTTVAEAEELAAIGKAKGVKLAVFQNRRWDSDLKTVKQVLSENLLGDLVEAEFHFDRYNPGLSLKQHKETANAGAGILKDLGPHLIDQALYLFGFPTAIYADIRTTRAESLVDDWIDLVLYYANFRVRLKAGFFVREANPAYVVHGKKGSFLKHRGDVQEDELKAGKKPNLVDWGMEPIAKEGLLHTVENDEIIRKSIRTLQGNYYDFFEGMYQAIVNDSIEPVTALEGIQVMQIIEAAIQSNREKKVIAL